MIKKYIIFGASSFVAQKTIKSLSKENIVIAFSRKKMKSNLKKLKYFKTNYKENEILKVLKKNINEKDFLTFVFFNAISDMSALLKIKKSEILRIINVNLITPILITNLIIKNFLQFKSNFIFMSSSRGHSGDKGISIYSTTKRGLSAFVKNMAIEYGSFGLNFRIILLFLMGAKNTINKKKIVNNIISRSSIERYIKISEVIRTIKFVQNDTTGNSSVIKCDNGYN